jgi:hypothetical protein
MLFAATAVREVERERVAVDRYGIKPEAVQLQQSAAYP